MRFLVDECTGPAVARWLREQQYEVYSVFENSRGMNDNEILQKAYAENWIIITNDKDFGERIYKEQYPHRGVILLRLINERAIYKIEVLQKLLTHYPNQLANNYIVVTETKIRFAHKW